jgi:hypothetical protein
MSLPMTASSPTFFEPVDVTPVAVVDAVVSPTVVSVVDAVVTPTVDAFVTPTVHGFVDGLDGLEGLEGLEGHYEFFKNSFVFQIVIIK